MPTAHDLLLSILEVFPEQPTPAEVLCEDCQAIDEAQVIGQFFRHRPWTSMSNADLIAHKAALGYFPASAFAYYLPAFLRPLLQDIEGADVIRESLMRELTFPTQEDHILNLHNYRQGSLKVEGMEDYLVQQIDQTPQAIEAFKEKVHRFSPAQSQCIATVLDHLSAESGGYFAPGDLSRAMERYWQQFLGDTPR